MKKLISNKIVLTIVLLTSVLISCRENRNFDRELEIFFVTVGQLINMFTLGLAALIVSIIGSTVEKPAARTIGIVLTAIFALITIVSFSSVLKNHAKFFMIFMIFFMELVMVVFCIYFSVKEKKIKSKNKNPHIKGNSISTDSNEEII